MYPIVWLVVFVVLVVAEFITAELTTIWFAGGALIAFLLSLFDVISIWVQLPVFLAVSILLLIFTRPLVARWFEKNMTKTNVETIPGRIAVVTEEVDNLRGKGQVEICGLIWTARAQNENQTIGVGEKVEILRVEGVKVIVKKYEEVCD